MLEREEMLLKDFISKYIIKNEITKIVLEWIWEDEGIDEEYSFEGNPSEFIEYYEKYYDCLDGFVINDVTELCIKNKGCITNIYIKIVKGY